MVPHYVKKGNAQPKYTKEDLNIAMQEVTAGTSTMYAAIKSTIYLIQHYIPARKA